MSGKTTIVVGGGWGDEGKGRVAAFIAKEENYDYCVRAGTGTNAGHSMHIDGKCYKTNQLPLAGILQNNDGSYPYSMVGSGVCVDPIKFKKEVNEYCLHNRVYVDRNCPLILPEHKERESNGENYSESHTGSTKSGTGEARVDMIRRIAKLAKDNPELPYVNIAQILNNAYNNGAKIIIEGTQSHYLSLYLSNEYPVVTSDNCTAVAFADDVGMAWNRIDEVVLVIKSAPTRVSQNCGILPGEISKEEMQRLGVCEFGVTTGRPRRKSLTIPFDMLEEVFLINSPTSVALTFCDHVDNVKDLQIPKMVNSDYIQKNMPKTFDNMRKIENRFNVPVQIIEYGKEFNRISFVVHK